MNYDTHVEVQAQDCEDYFQEFKEYQLEDVIAILKHLEDKAKRQGLENTYFRFSSELDPYEDVLNPPSVTVYGFREKTQSELIIDKEEKAIEALAKEKGITFYEARVLKTLMDKGVV